MDEKTTHGERFPTEMTSRSFRMRGSELGFSRKLKNLTSPFDVAADVPDEDADDVECCIDTPDGGWCGGGDENGPVDIENESDNCSGIIAAPLWNLGIPGKTKKNSYQQIRRLSISKEKSKLYLASSCKIESFLHTIFYTFWTVAKMSMFWRSLTKIWYFLLGRTSQFTWHSKQLRPLYASWKIAHIISVSSVDG